MCARIWMSTLLVVSHSGVSANLAWARDPEIEDGQIFTTSKNLEFELNQSDESSKATLESDHKFRNGFCQLDREIPAHSTGTIPQGTLLKFKYVAPTGLLSAFKKTTVLLTNPETGTTVAELSCFTGLSVNDGAGETQFDANEIKGSYLQALGLLGVNANVGSNENKSQPKAPSIPKIDPPKIDSTAVQPVLPGKAS